MHPQYFCTQSLSPQSGTATTIVSVPRGGIQKTRALSFMRAAYTQLSSCCASWRLSSDCSYLAIPLPYSIYCDWSKKCLHSFALCNMSSFTLSKALTWRLVLPGKALHLPFPHTGAHALTLSVTDVPSPYCPYCPLQPSLAWRDGHRQGLRKSVPPPGRKIKLNLQGQSQHRREENQA